MCIVLPAPRHSTTDWLAQPVQDNVQEEVTAMEVDEQPNSAHEDAQAEPQGEPADEEDAFLMYCFDHCRDEDQQHLFVQLLQLRSHHKA